MGLLDKIADTNLGFQGNTPPSPSLNTNQSPLHNSYSINGLPNMVDKPTPSLLDLNGVTPPKYLDNPPT